MRASRFQYKNDMICSICGEIITVIQSDARKPKLFKVIEKQCPKCEKQRKFIVVEDIETARQILSTKLGLNQELTTTESILYELLKKQEQKKKIK